jgi:hypothetical protein
MANERFEDKSIEDLFGAEILAVRSANGDAEALFQKIDDATAQRVSDYVSGVSLSDIAGDIPQFFVERSVRHGLNLVRKNLKPTSSDEAHE